MALFENVPMKFAHSVLSTSLVTSTASSMQYLPESASNYLTTVGYDALDKGVLPDAVVRRAIRYLCNQRLHDISVATMEDQADSKWQYIEDLKKGAIAIETEAANEQHYEVCTASLRC